MSDSHDCAGDATPYVLGALEADEARRFEDHLASCSICQDEVASLQELTYSLATSVPHMTAPRRVRRAVMAEVRLDARSRQTRPARRPALRGFGALAAGLAVAAAVFAAVNFSGGAPGTAVYPASTGDAQVRITGDRVELVVHHLRHLGPGKVYEVWLRDGQQAPQPTNALFDVSARGNGTVRVPGDFKHVDELMVTAEPAGGSAVPTDAPVVVTRLS